MVTDPKDAPTGIGQIAVPVEDVERATAFYRDVVGLQHLFSAPPGLAFFKCGTVRLMLARPEDRRMDPPGSILYYTTHGLDGAHRRLSGAGVEVVSAPHAVHRTDDMELWMGFYHDSEGNVFALMEERDR